LSIKNELIELILAAGLIEDFISYLKNKNVEMDSLGSIYDVDENLIIDYAKERKLIEEFDSEKQEEEQKELELEPRSIRPRTPPKK
jgi:hypothetical protein